MMIITIPAEISDRSETFMNSLIRKTDFNLVNSDGNLMNDNINARVEEKGMKETRFDR